MVLTIEDEANSMGPVFTICGTLSSCGSLLVLLTGYLFPHMLRNRRFIAVALWGPLQTWGRRGVQESCRPCLAKAEVELSEDGLLEGLCWAKDGLKRLRDEGPCADCASGPTEYPRKRLKATGLPKCEECIIRAVLH